MRTSAEVKAWCIGALEKFGDPSQPVCQLFLSWHDDINAIDGEELACGVADNELWLVLSPEIPLFKIPVRKGEAEVTELGELHTFGAEQITDGVWSITPSLNVPGVIHGFLVLYGVPDPAPWERRIVLP